MNENLRTGYVRVLEDSCPNCGKRCSNVTVTRTDPLAWYNKTTETRKKDFVVFETDYHEEGKRTKIAIKKDEIVYLEEENKGTTIALTQSSWWVVDDFETALKKTEDL